MTTTRRFEVQNHDGQTIAEGVLFRDGTTVMQTPDLAAVTHMFKTFEDFTASTIGAVHWIGEDGLSAGDDLASRLRLAHEARKEADRRRTDIAMANAGHHDRLSGILGLSDDASWATLMAEVENLKAHADSVRDDLRATVFQGHDHHDMSWKGLLEVVGATYRARERQRTTLAEILGVRDDDADTDDMIEVIRERLDCNVE